MRLIRDIFKHIYLIRRQEKEMWVNSTEITLQINQMRKQYSGDENYLESSDDVWGSTSTFFFYKSLINREILPVTAFFPYFMNSKCLQLDTIFHSYLSD